MLRRIALLLPLSLLLAACSGGAGGSAGDPATGSSQGPVALSVRWPASLTGGPVRAASIRLPSRVRALSMEVQVLGADFPGQRHTVEVRREGGREVTTVDGVAQPPETTGLDLQVPVGAPRRFYVTATADVVDAVGTATTLHFTGFLDLAVTGEGDRGVVVLHDGDGSADGVPQITRVALADGGPPTLRVDSAAVDLNVFASFSDDFEVFEPPAAWSSDDPGVARVDDDGVLRPAGKGSATLTVTVGGVALQLPVVVENTPPMDLTTADRLPPAGEGEPPAGIADQTVEEDASLTLELAADDPDGDPLTFTATSDAPQVAASVSGRRLTLTPAPDFNGTAQITVAASDNDGGTTSGTFLLTVLPVNDAPVIVPPPARTIAQGEGLPPLTAHDVEGDGLTFTLAGGSLPPSIVLAADGTFSGTADFTRAGRFTATVAVSDGHGGRDDVEVEVTVLDRTPPAFGVLEPLVVEATGPTTAVTLGPVSATDLVDGPLVAQADPSGPFGVGSHTITWTATDAAGNTATATQQVVVQDTTPPVVTAPAPVTVEATGPTTPVSLGTATATDLVDGPLAASADSSGPFAVGSHTITWTATDAAGNTATATQQVVVQDTTPPVVTAPAPVTVEATGPTTAVTLGPVSATDLVDGALAAIASPSGPFAVGSHTITWTATDAAGNTATAQQEVVVQDTTPPVVTAPAPVTLEATGPTTAVSLGTATATDLVDGALAAIASPSGPFGVGSHTITWTATDAAGNTATAQQEVVVQDTTPPEVTLLFPMGGIVGTQVAGTGGVPIDVVVTALQLDTVARGTATDVVGVTSVTVNGRPATVTPVGGTMVAWEAPLVDPVPLDGSGVPLVVVATDAAGNASPATSLATLLGAPAASVPSIGGGVPFSFPLDLAADPSGSGGVVVLDPSATDGVIRVAADGVRTPFSVGQLPTAVTPLALLSTKGEIYLLDGKPAQLLAIDPVDATRHLVSDNLTPPDAPLFSFPFSVAEAPSGGLVVADAGTILEVDPITGVRTDLFPAGLPTCCATRIASGGPTGDVYYLDGELFDVVHAISGGGGAPLGALGAVLSSPSDLAVEPAGTVVIADGDTVVRVAPGTKPATTTLSDPTNDTGPSFSLPEAITVDRLGRIFLLGAGSGVVGVWQIDPVTGDRALISASPLMALAAIPGVY